MATYGFGIYGAGIYGIGGILTVHNIAIGDTYSTMPPGTPTITNSGGVEDLSAAKEQYIKLLAPLYRFLLVQGHSITVTVDGTDITPCIAKGYYDPNNSPAC